MKREPASPIDTGDFSLVLGGPLFQLFRRCRLSDDALELLTRRIIVIALFCWLPLLVLSYVEHRLLPGSTTVPFLLDIEVHVRFLVALPLLVGAELLVHRRLRPVVGQLRGRDLIPENEVPRYEAALASAHRLRSSLVAELVLIAIVLGFGFLVASKRFVAFEVPTWYMKDSASGPSLSLAGAWFRYVSLPLFQFVFLRWYFRLFVWTRFLWQVSRIPLKLVPTHPDRAGGIGFLSSSVLGFAPLLMGQGATMAGQIANRIYFLGAKLPEFKWEILALVVIAVSSVFAPLLVFLPQLARARRKGLREYGTLAQGYVREFDLKWLRGAAPAEEPFIGSADIQSLADLGNSFEVVQSMRISLITRGAVLQLAILTATPFAPLLLTMMPLEDLLKTLFGVLF